MELVTDGDLRGWVKKLRSELKGQTKSLLAFARGICEALKYLETKKVVHQDLAARNCLLAAAPKAPAPAGLSVKLADFGLATVAGGGGGKAGKDGKRIPVKWSAPEALAKEEFSSKSDIWSFGVLLYEMWSGGGEPWPGKKTDEVRKDVAAGRRMDLPAALPAALADLITAVTP